MTETYSPAHPTVRWTTLLRRGWPALLLGLALGAGVGLYLDAIHTDVYQASASVLVTPTGVASTTQVANGRTTGLVNLDTEANLIKSTAVLSRAQTVLKTSETIKTIAGRITVTVPPNSQLLKILYASPSPAKAQQGATAVAEAYLAERAATAAATIKTQKTQVQGNIATSTKLLQKAATTLTSTPVGSADRQFAQSQRDLLTRQITQLNAQLVTLDNTVVTPGQITETAATPTKPSGSGTKLFLASGIAGGLLLGLFGAYLLARRQIRRLRRSEDVSDSIGLPVIARIEKLQMGMLAADRTPAAESYRRLANVVNASLGSRGGVIVIAGCDDSAVASTVTHNMAATLSRAGEKVAVLRAGGGSPGSNGSRAGSGSGSDSGDNDVEGQYRLLAGTGPRTRKLIGEMRKDEDGFILIDVPEPLKTADAQSYAAGADAVLVVMRNRTRTSQARRVLAEFDAVSAPILGAVMVKIDESPRHDGQPIESYAALNAGQNGARAINAGPGSVLVEDLELHDYSGSAALAAQDKLARGAAPVSRAGRRVARQADRARSRRSG